jgi:hypothetical protein
MEPESTLQIDDQNQSYIVLGILSVFFVLGKKKQQQKLKYLQNFHFNCTFSTQ